MRIILLLVLLGGCKLFTPCPKCAEPPPPMLVEVRLPCDLPPPLTLPGVVRRTDGCPEGLVCYDVANAARIAERESALKQWLKEARARCGVTN